MEHAVETIHRQVIERFPMYTANAAFEQWLLERTDGDAAKVDEYLNLLADYGVLDGEGRLTGDFTSPPAPAAVIEDVAARVDRLDADTRRLLEIGSIEGEHFSQEVVSAISGEADVSTGLLKGVEAGVLARDGGEALYSRFATRYRFVPLRARKFIYDRIPEEERQRLHMAFVDLLTAELGRAQDAGAQEMLSQMISEHNKTISRPE